MKKVIVVALSLMFIIPLFDADIYTDQANSFEYTLATLNQMLQSTPDQISLAQINEWLNYAIQDHQT